MTKYLSIADVAKNWSLSKRRLQILCRDGRIKNAVFVGNMWVIPSDAEKPDDARIKTKKDDIDFIVFRRELKDFLRKILQRKTNISQESFKTCILIALSYNIANESIGTLTKDEKKILKGSLFKHFSCNEIHEKIVDSLIQESKNIVKKYALCTENILSWSYQYLNELGYSSLFAKTQFFTEQYMVDFIASHTRPNLKDKIADPCCGGGNFLIKMLEMLCLNIKKSSAKQTVMNALSNLYGFDIDPKIALLCSLNIKIKAIQIIRKYSKSSIDIWNDICPNIYYGEPGDNLGFLAWEKKNNTITHTITKEKTYAKKIFSDIDLLVTNPPFETRKGMDISVREYLQKEMPLVNSDTCVAFISCIKNLLSLKGQCGIVTQNSWMFLDSFDLFRKQFFSNYQIEKLVNLGSGAFYDLSGEKTNVSLIILKRAKGIQMKFSYLDLTNAKIEEKISHIRNQNAEWVPVNPKGIAKNGSRLDFSTCNELKKIPSFSSKYGEYGCAMQGTSTGDAKNLVHFFWQHFNSPAWKIVSKGGGYCRWLGLNSYVVKWGENGEFIKNTKGSALRNVDFFDKTSLVFSDTGTSGLNVRKLLPQQLFIASGPGIRIEKGNVFNHLAYLNSRIASYFIRESSPKLTIAAGYINRLPINEDILFSEEISLRAKKCLDIKREFLAHRANCLEYSEEFNSKINLRDIAQKLFLKDVNNELKKLQLESEIDNIICKHLGLTHEAESYLASKVDCCAYNIISAKDAVSCDLDLYLNGLLDDACCLRKTRVAKNSLGCDGLIEFAARSLIVNPKHLVKKITTEVALFSNVINRYENMLLHNFVLHFMKYNVTKGLGIKSIKMNAFIQYAEQKGLNSTATKHWLRSNFNTTHESIFFKSGFIQLKDGNLEQKEYE